MFVYYLLSAALTVMTIVGGLWATPWAKQSRQRRRRMDRLLNDWHGEPARPGYKEQPSYPERMATNEGRLASIEDKLLSRPELTTLWNGLRVIEFNLADLHTDLKAVETRMDGGQRRALKAEGRVEEQLRSLHTNLLVHVAHDAAVHNQLRAAGFVLPPEPGVPIIVDDVTDVDETVPKPRPGRKRAERVSQKESR